MHSKNEILDSLYKSDKVIVFMNTKLPPACEDLKQEVFMLLLLKPDAEIIDLHKRGKLFSFFASLMFNQLYWSRSKYNKLYPSFEQLATIEAGNIEAEADLTNDIEAALSSIGAYENAMVRVYAKYGNYREAGEATGIAWKTVYNIVTKAREEIKSKIEL